MSRLYKVILICSIFLLQFYSPLFALSPETHENMNEFAARNTLGGFSLHTYLQNQLDFENGIKEEIEGNGGLSITTTRLVWDWIKMGGKTEDIPYRYMQYLRSVNHFHNPLTDSGFSGIWSTGFLSGKSSIQWSQEPLGTQRAAGGLYSGYYSWHDVRNYFYNALTLLDKTARDQNFSDAFRGLGQLTHLVQDLSVPEHARDDGHYVTYNYEEWVKGTDENSKSNVSIFSETGVIRIHDTDLQNYINITPDLMIFFDPTSIGNTNPLASVPVANLFDTNQYDGTNPDITLQSDIGVSEYANANFLSSDTIFSGNFPYPAWSSVVEYNKEVDTTGKVRTYLRKTGDGETIEHLATTMSIYKYLPSSLKRFGLKLDKTVYADYASKLIPRAVGYSAGLLNYFFRGEIDLEEAQGGLGYVIVNNTEEDMDGIFEIYYDDIDDVRQLLWSTPGNLFVGALSRSSSFNLPSPIDPKGDGKYILVFKGKLGNEDNAVVGKVVEPKLYFIALPVDHDTRETLGKQYYYVDKIAGSTTMVSIAESELPFGLVDDGGYWDPATSSWSVKPDGFGVPLDTIGPQYVANYWDKENQRVRFILNGSYEEEAYDTMPKLITDSTDSGAVVKQYYNVYFSGSPRARFGAYQGNTGYTEYIDAPQFGLYDIRSIAREPAERFPSSYRTVNFSETFLEYDTAKFFYFDFAGELTVDEQAIPKDPDAPFPSIVSVSKTGNTFNINIPKVFLFRNSLHSSGIDTYILNIGSSTRYSSTGNKCTSEDIFCLMFADGSQSVFVPDFKVPYNFNSWVQIYYNSGLFREELYINGRLVETSSPASDILTHYQVLAVYKDIALIRETNFVSESETETRLQYTYTTEGSLYRPVYERGFEFAAKYYIYVNGNRYDLPGITNVKSRSLWRSDYGESTHEPINYAEFIFDGGAVEDITGYHLDRIFINDSFDGKYILVAFDEYEYNNGAGLVHTIRYEPVDDSNVECDDFDENGCRVLYYGIPLTSLQNVDHEGTRVGRQLLLFGEDGTFQKKLDDPIGLNFTIGSIGILK